MQVALQVPEIIISDILHQLSAFLLATIDNPNSRSEWPPCSQQLLTFTVVNSGGFDNSSFNYVNL